MWARGRLRSGNSPALAEKIILPGDRDRLGCVTQIRVQATCQRDEFSLCTSKFESDMPSHAVQPRRRHFRAWKNARSVARVPLVIGARSGLGGMGGRLNAYDRLYRGIWNAAPAMV